VTLKKNEEASCPSSTKENLRNRIIDLGVNGEAFDSIVS
jgi:hypothetical protein